MRKPSGCSGDGGRPSGRDLGLGRDRARREWPWRDHRR